MPVVLVTGAAGSVGRELVSVLASRSTAVRAFDLPSANFDPLSDLPSVTLMPRDISNSQDVAEAVVGVDCVIHLAALLPPASEKNKERTFQINVTGTQNLIDAAHRLSIYPHFVLASSVSTYGDTTDDDPPIATTHRQASLDIYAESKIAAEAVAKASELPFTILRIAGISIPEVLEPPAVWPFQANQRIEFVNRADVVLALAACVGNSLAKNKVFNVGGGQTWQMKGRDYVESQYELLDLPAESAQYAVAPGWFDWYDTQEGQAALSYQKTDYPAFLAQLQRAIEEEFV